MPSPAWFADPGAILVMAVRAAGQDLACELSPWVRDFATATWSRLAFFAQSSVRAGEGIRRATGATRDCSAKSLSSSFCSASRAWPQRYSLDRMHVHRPDCSSFRSLHSGAVHEVDGICLLKQHYGDLEMQSPMWTMNELLSSSSTTNLAGPGTTSRQSSCPGAQALIHPPL